MSLFDWFLAIAPDSMQPDLDSPLKNKKWVEILMSNFNGYENKKGPFLTYASDFIN